LLFKKNIEIESDDGTQNYRIIDKLKIQIITFKYPKIKLNLRTSKILYPCMTEFYLRRRKKKRSLPEIKIPG